MAARSVICPECGATVPYGRLSCTACGSLLASVAGAPRRREALALAPSVTAEPPPLLVDDATASWSVIQSGRDGNALDDDTDAAPGDLDDAAEPAPPASPADTPESEPAGWPDTEPARDPSEPAPGPHPDHGEEVPGIDAPGDVDDLSEPPPPDVELARAAQPLDAVGWPPASSLRGPATWAPPPLAASEPPPARTPAGAYLPPSAAFGPAAGAVPTGAATSGATASGRSPASGATTQTRLPASGTPRAGNASLLADLPFDAPDDLPGWLAALGSALAVVGFLLPWSTSIPFVPDVGYFNTWGLATGSHLAVFVAVLALFALALLPNRIPRWILCGVVPLALGSLLVGLVWPYLLDGFGAHAGSWLVAIGGLVLAIGGVFAVRPTRHATGPRDV